MATYTVTDPTSGKKVTLTSQDDTPPTEQELEEVFSSMQGQTENKYLSSTPLPDAEQSPLKLGQRIALGMAGDTESRRALLKRDFKYVEDLPGGKFAVGNDPRNLQPADPAGIFNDVMGDVADVANVLLPAVGQIVAAGIGSGAGPGGTIVGGALGAGAGEAANVAIGKMLGVRTDSAQTQVTDVAISTLFGAGGEAIGQAAKYAGKRVIQPRIAKMMDDAIAKSQKVDPITGAIIDAPQSPVVQAMAKLFKFTAAVDEQATMDAAKHGFANTFTPDNLNPRGIIGIAADVRRAAEVETFRLGQEVGRYSDTLIDRAKKIGPSARIGTDDLFMVFRKKAQDLGIIDDMGNINKNYPVKEDLGHFRGMLAELGEVDDGRYVVKPGKKITIEKAVQLTRSFGQKFDKMNPKVQHSFDTILNGDDKFPGIRQRLIDFADSIDLPDYKIANKNFSDFKNIMSGLKQIEHENPAVTEAFLKNLENKAHFTQDALKVLQARVPDIKFLDRLEKFNAAQKFLNASPDLLRFGTVASLVGTQFLPFGGDDPSSRGAKLVAGLALGTPAGLRTVLTASSKLGKVAQGKGKYLKPNKKSQQLLTAILGRQGVEAYKDEDNK